MFNPVYNIYLKYFSVPNHYMYLTKSNKTYFRKCTSFAYSEEFLKM